jgi:hypothetical protein
MSMPSLRSSPCTRGAPLSGLSRHNRRIRSRTSFGTAGLPGLPRRSFHVRNRRKPIRCQAITVCGLTIDKRRSPVGPDLAQPCPEESIRRRQSRPLHRALRDAGLVPERQVLPMECGPGFEGCRKGSGQHVKRADRRTEDLKEDMQTPCSHAVRDLR